MIIVIFTDVTLHWYRWVGLCVPIGGLTVNISADNRLIFQFTIGRLLAKR